MIQPPANATLPTKRGVTVGLPGTLSSTQPAILIVETADRVSKGGARPFLPARGCAAS